MVICPPQLPYVLDYRSVSRSRELRESEAPRGGQEWEVIPIPGPGVATRGNRVTGAWGQLEPQERSWDSGGGGRSSLLPELQHGAGRQQQLRTSPATPSVLPVPSID
ncbi:hypothetical protein AAY473_011910 [Plecturocebus cupreus]